MPRNINGGNKAKRGKNRRREIKFITRDTNSFYAKVIGNLGNGQCRLSMFDNKMTEITGVIRGSLRRAKFKKDDVVLVSKRDFGNSFETIEKYDILHKYNIDHINNLIRIGEINMKMIEDDNIEFYDDDDNVNFDNENELNDSDDMFPPSDSDEYENYDEDEERSILFNKEKVKLEPDGTETVDNNPESEQVPKDEDKKDDSESDGIEQIENEMKTLQINKQVKTSKTDVEKKKQKQKQHKIDKINRIMNNDVGFDFDFDAI
jgi:initiation factor 1A